MEAEDAAHFRDGHEFYGSKIRVEIARDRDRPKDRHEDKHESENPKDSRTEHRLLVSNLPHRCSWQDLKDHFRRAGDVVYCVINTNNEGIVEFKNKDMKNKFNTTRISIKQIRYDETENLRAKLHEGNDLN